MQLRWYQTEASCTAFNHVFCGGPEAGNPIVTIPTGGGKSAIIGDLCRKAIEQDGRVVVLAHRKELLEQNADKIARFLPDHIAIGTYSAGLKKKETNEPVLVAGIQSVFRKAHELGRRHLVIIDEAHLVPNRDEGMYRDFLRDLGKINPRLRVIGLTATPFRTGEGSICSPDGIFRRECYTVPIQRLIAEGFLCEITSTAAKGSLDTSSLHIRAGEFISSEVENLFDQSPNVTAACREVVEMFGGRRSCIVFCCAVLHAEHVAAKIEEFTGENVGLVTGETPPLVRAATLENFKNGLLRWLINVDVLTTGFDSPNIDAIAVMRATASPGLFAQICGRGLRTSPHKTNCLILDFGENVKRHGPIDAADYGMKPKKQRSQKETETESDGNKKRCPGCNEETAANTRRCDCGFIFPFNHQGNAASDDVLSKPKRFVVDEVKVNRHKKAKGDGPNTLRIDYDCQTESEIDKWKELDSIDCPHCGAVNTAQEHGREIDNDSPHKGRLDCRACGSYIQWLPRRYDRKLGYERISEWVCLEHPTGFALTKAKLWWRAHTNAEFPEGIFSVDEFGEEVCVSSPIDQAIDLFNRGAFAMPHHITVVREGKFWKIVKAELDPKPESWSEEVAEPAPWESQPQDEEAPF